MAYYHNTKSWYFVLYVILGTLSVDAEPQVPCYFIFGDSFASAGTYNAPYDFPPGQATRRLTNGRTTADIIGELLGFENFIDPPEVGSPKLGGVKPGLNYAARNAGVRYANGFSSQLLSHRSVVGGYHADFGGNCSAAAEQLNKCLYSVGFGSSDYLKGFFPWGYPRVTPKDTPENYANDLITEYSRLLKFLYEFGARKVVVNGVGRIGCPRFAMDYFNGRENCVDDVNNAAQLFNTKLVSLVDQLNKELAGAKFIYINNYAMFDSLAASFKITKKSCCEGKWDGSGECISARVCENRSEYLFFDEITTTEAANRILANRAYKASDPSDAHPYDITHLVAA